MNKRFLNHKRAKTGAIMLSSVPEKLEKTLRTMAVRERRPLSQLVVNLLEKAVS